MMLKSAGGWASYLPEKTPKEARATSRALASCANWVSPVASVDGTMATPVVMTDVGMVLPG